MKTTFTIPQRVAAIFALRSIAEASITELRTRNAGLKVLDFTPDELKKFGFTVANDAQYAWDTTKEATVDMEIEDNVKELICAQLEKLSGMKKVPLSILPACDLFLPESSDQKK